MQDHAAAQAQAGTAGKRAPAYQHYAGDWLADPRIALMTPAQEGAYIRLLSYAWMDPDGSLPDEDEALALLSRLGEDWLKGGSSRVRGCFVQAGGRLRSPMLDRERQKQAEWRAKSAAGGRKSGAARRSAKRESNSGHEGYAPKGGSDAGQPQDAAEPESEPSGEAEKTGDGQTKGGSTFVSSSDSVSPSPSLSGSAHPRKKDLSKKPPSSSSSLSPEGEKRLGAVAEWLRSTRNELTGKEGKAPDREITIQIARMFGNWQQFSAYIENVRDRAPEITGNGYGFFVADAERFLNGGC